MDSLPLSPPLASQSTRHHSRLRPRRAPLKPAVAPSTAALRPMWALSAPSPAATATTTTPARRRDSIHVNIRCSLLWRALDEPKQATKMRARQAQATGRVPAGQRRRRRGTLTQQKQKPRRAVHSAPSNPGTCQREAAAVHGSPYTTMRTPPSPLLAAGYRSLALFTVHNRR